MSRLVRNIFSGYAFRAVTLALMLLCTPIYIDRLGLAGFGLVGLSLVLAGLLQILDFGAGQIVTRCLARDGADPPALAASVAMLGWLGLIQALIAGALAVGGWLAAPWLATGWLGAGPEVGAALGWMVIAVALGWPLGLATAAMAGFQEIARFNRDALLFGVLRYVGAVGVLVGIEASPTAFFQWQALVALLQVLAAIQLITRRAPPLTGRAIRAGLGRIGEEMRLAGGLLVFSASGAILAQIDMIWLSWGADLTDLGRYNVGLTLAGLIQQIPGPLVLALIPRLTELSADPPAQARLARQATALMALGAGVPALLFATLGPTLLTLWTGDATLAAETAPILLLLALGAMLNAASWLRVTLLVAARQAAGLVRLNLLALILFAPATGLSVGAGGGIGAAGCRFALSALYLLILLRGWPRLNLTPGWGRGALLDLLRPWLGGLLGIAALLLLAPPVPDWALVILAGLAGGLGGLAAAPQVLAIMRTRRTA